MVMKRNMMRRNLRQSIWRSMGRFLAILSIIALGCAMFVGLRVTKTDMIETGQKYTQEQHMFDLRLLNTYGWDMEDVETIQKMEGVDRAEGSVTVDAFVQVDGGESKVYRLYSLPEKVNQVYLLGGRLPEKSSECLIDGAKADDSILGTTVTVTAENSADTLESLKSSTFTVVGYVSTPLYMDMTRGNTTLGSGVVSSYLYIPEDAFAVDYYTEINITMAGSWRIYEERYNDALDDMAERIEPALKPLADKRLEVLRAEGEKSYAEGLAEYEKGLAEYEKSKADALKELEDALKKLQEGQAELDENRKTLEEGEAQLADALIQWNQQQKTLEQGKVELENQKAQAYAKLAEASAQLMENYKTVSSSLKQVESGLAQIDDGIAQIDDGIGKIKEGLAQIEEGLPKLELMVSLLDSSVSVTETALEAAKNNPVATEEQIAKLEQELEKLKAQRDDYAAQQEQALQTQAQLQEQLPQLEQKRQELAGQKQELLKTQSTLNDAMTAIHDGQKELESNQFQAENQFAAALAQLNAGQLQLDSAKAQLDEKTAELEAGKQALTDAQKQLDEGMAEYEKGKAEAEAEFQKAEAELQKGKAELDDARCTLDTMAEPKVYALTRNTNPGYLALDNNSDIVSSVSTVFPVFFLLIAALVCITTMTRMVEEERTQIGTLKAMGYSSAAIMSKYLLYSGFASLLGCALGVAVGSSFFPVLLWNAYGIMFNITPKVELIIDWQLCIGITVDYLLVSSLVTWYCCHRTLREVPAQLIRPKAPTAGKKIFLEYLPFWKKLSFLNKVMLRNVLRYRQRFLMMLIGIGGCTALLLTGFGLRDTIVDVANIQYEEVDVFDIQVYFSESRTQAQQKAFREALEGKAQSIGFYYQSSVELTFDDASRDVYMIVSDETVTDFIDFHRGKEQLSLPGKGEALVSAGVAEILGLEVGDTVTVRNANLQALHLCVSGVYDNHVNNYIITNPETLADQWGQVPESQMAYVTAKEGTDVHDLSAAITAMEDVMNISVSADTAELVDSMMSALDLVVLVVVVSAGLLAAIVLYNLTNININERIREIATIKVLGFNAAETSAYVFKENMLLTVLGAAFGLLLGRAFLAFVMSKIKIDFVWFQTRLALPSYIYSVLLTLLCALAVAVVFHKRLQKINMAEALKSVE